MNAFTELDEKPLSRFHLLAMLTTGMGVFTDGYDLASIGIVLGSALGSFGIHTIGVEAGYLAAAAHLGSALGAVVFGALAQRGRKRYYGLDVAVMALAAAAQAFAPSLWALVAIRFVLGFGIGADYVLSPTIMAEHANRRDRGKQLGFGFAAMWGFGAMVAALVLLALEAAGVPPDLRWRIVLAGGAVPALSVVILRRRMPETARYLARLGGEADRAKQVIEDISGSPVAAAPLTDRRAWQEVFATHARVVFGAAALWLLYDVVVYSSSLFGPTVLASELGLGPAGFTLVSYGCFLIPGTLLGCILIDRAGRRALLAIGFGLGGLALFAFAPLQRSVGTAPISALAFFGVFGFTMSLGPGAVAGSGLLGVELSPTRIRSIAQAVTVVGGRLGASIAGFGFPVLLGYITKGDLVAILGATCLAGAALTFVLVPETKGRSLEDINRDTDAAIAR